MADALVVNASPLVFLGSAGRLSLLQGRAREGQVPDARATILELRASGMWLSDATIARALKAAGLE